LPAVKPSNIPARIAIAHDDHHAARIGRPKDGRQFFVTTPFVPALGANADREFIAGRALTAKRIRTYTCESTFRVSAITNRHLLTHSAVIGPTAGE
jgi:hypothetical protein